MANANAMAKAALQIQEKVKNDRPLAVNEFKAVVGGFKSQIEAALPVFLKKNAEKYARQALTLFSENPKLQQASPITILSALMKASSLGLDLSPQLGQCYIIPYNNHKLIDGRWTWVIEAQFQIGYRGAICLAQRSNRVARIAADVVRQGDYFDYSKGLFPKLEHKPSEGERGDITYVYALANFTNGGYAFEVWPVKQVIEHAQKFSKSYYTTDKKTKKQIINPASTWHTNFESMAKKTLVMSIWKYLPIETELMLAGAQDGTTVTDISHVTGNEKEVLEVLPEERHQEAISEGEDHSEDNGNAPEEINPQPQPTAQPEKHSSSAPAEMVRILDDVLGDFGLGLNSEEKNKRIREGFGKNMDELTAQELNAAIEQAKKDLSAKDGKVAK